MGEPILTAEYADRSIKENINKFLVPLQRAGLKQLTLDNYRESLYRDLWYLYSSGYNTTPSKISSVEIDHLISKRWVGAPKYNHNRRSVFFRFLEYHENNIVKEYPTPRNLCVRSTIGPDKWMSDDEAIAMYLACESPLEKWVIHAELKLALRRFDMTNVTRDDVYFGYIDVLGKGNKKEPVAFVSDTRQVLEDLYVYLDEVTAGIENPPRDLLLYRVGSYHARVGVLQKTALDNMIKRIAKRAGIERSVSHHMLRRTCARMWKRSGAPIDDIQMMLRHSSRETTMIYLGLTVDDKSTSAMRFDDYFNQQKANFRRKGFSQEDAIASKSGGLGEILSRLPHTGKQLLMCC